MTITSKSIHSLKELQKRNAITEKRVTELEPVVENFSFAVTENMYEQINLDDPNDPIGMQFIPTEKELNILPQEKSDPIGDNVHTKTKGLIHRYPDRCLLMPVHVCAVYCRFCFRREKVGAGSKVMSQDELELAYSYIREHKEIWEVILTGGDPFFLKPAMLDKILENLSSIEHVGVVRFHTRIPVVEPSRINAAMLKVLQKKIPVYVVIHANHANEFTVEAKKACHDLINHGIPLLSQTVLLKGINDNIETLSTLMKCFIQNKIKPYYLHQGDLAQGTQHFRTSIKHGQSLMRQLRGRFSGICQPTYVLDIPGSYGKSPIGPNYLTELPDDSPEKAKYRVEDYNGNRHSYNEYIDLT
jgi:lysine 2,3-aminomutase